MRLSVRLVAAAAALAATTLAASPARADDTVGTLPGDSFMSLGFDVGRLDTDTVLATGEDGMGPPGPTELGGFFGIMRFSMGGYVRPTRFDSAIGIEGSVGLGILDKKSVTLPGPNEESRLFFDMELGLNANVLRFAVLDRMLGLKLVGGVGFNLDMAYVYAGARTYAELIPDAVVGEAAYTFRWGDTYDDVLAKEHRMGGTLVFKSIGVSIGAELWIGDQTARGVDAVTMQEVVVPTPDREFKGEYVAIVGSLAYRWF